MVKRVYNFNPGPATLPLPVLEKAQTELLDYRDTGISILETSHRSKEFDDVISQASSLLKEVYGVPDNYKVLWLQGGASTQFFMIPKNLMMGMPIFIQKLSSRGQYSVEKTLFRGHNI